MPPTQANRPLRVQTPLGPDNLLIVRLQGTEAISQLFNFQLELLAENATTIAFDKLIGQKIGIEMDMPGGKKRHFHGICKRFSEGRRDATFTRYAMEVVPQFWLLTRRTQSRIYQHLTVSDILKQVLKGFDVKWDIQGQFFERDYCVQYRESDFAFASRLMEEEGIYYYFDHTAKGHTLVVANTPTGHAPVPVETKAIFEDVRGGNREDMRVHEWEKVQELRSGKITLWDHCFELPQQNLEAQKTIQESVKVGKVEHKLKVADNDKLEMYDYPGAYAQRFDGIDSGGGNRAGDLKKIFQDNGRVALLYAQREAAESLDLRGASNCRQFAAGHKFTLERHFNADGEYVLTSVTHKVEMGADYRSGEGAAMAYDNSFTCLPAALPYRPPLNTPKPNVGGTQTATVVGPPGEIIFCDKYGRIKVQFHWDRQGKKNAESSCWVRVSQNWGGAGWGGMFIPHVGQEVIVDFEEGDPDSPLITGRVYNAEAMPPLELPANKTQCVISDHGGNVMSFQGDPGKQRIAMSSPHGNTTFAIGALGSPGEGIEGVTDLFFKATVGLDWKVKITGSEYVLVDKEEKKEVTGNSTKLIRADSTTMIWGNKVESIKGHEKKDVLGTTFSMVVGADTKIVMGLRNDVTGGIRLNIMKGNRYESNPNGALQSQKDLHKVGWVLQQLGKVYQKIGGNKIVELVEDKTKAKVHKRHEGRIEDKVEQYDIDASTSYHCKSPKIILEGPVLIKGNLEVEGDLNVTGEVHSNTDVKLD